METTPEEFISELLSRFAKLPDGHERLQQIATFTNSDDAFLTLDKGETTSTFPAIQHRFATCWPDEHPLSGPEAIALVTAARKRDRLLQKRVDRLVPKKVTERAFWRHYFSRVHAVLVAEEPSVGDKIACHVDALPRPRPAAERRFPAAATLQMSGTIERERMIEFLIGCTKMVTSEESLGLVSRAACDAGADIANVMLTYQLEYMESMGLDRRFGVALMSPTVINKRFPGDEQLGKIVHSFMQHCAQAAQIALMTANQRAPADVSQRKWAPAATLQREGTLSDDALRQLLERCVVAFSEPSVAAELLDAMRAQNRSADSILIRWQREFLEAEGLDQDFGVGQLRALPGRAAAAAAARGAGELPAADGGASDLDRAVAALKAMADAMQQLGAQATIEYQKPTPQELALRRFKPADTLRSAGALDRADILKFCADCAKWLLDEESADKLGALEEQAAGPMSVMWQREYLETMGIEQDYGCRQLAGVPERFKSDREVIVAFSTFQAACMQSMKQAALKRAELAKQRAEAKAEIVD